MCKTWISGCTSTLSLTTMHSAVLATAPLSVANTPPRAVVWLPCHDGRVYVHTIASPWSSCTPTTHQRADRLCRRIGHGAHKDRRRWQQVHPSTELRLKPSIEQHQLHQPLCGTGISNRCGCCHDVCISVCALYSVVNNAWLTYVTTCRYGALQQGGDVGESKLLVARGWHARGRQGCRARYLQAGQPVRACVTSRCVWLTYGACVAAVAVVRYCAIHGSSAATCEKERDQPNTGCQNVPQGHRWRPRDELYAERTPIDVVVRARCVHGLQVDTAWMLGPLVHLARGEVQSMIGSRCSHKHALVQSGCAQQHRNMIVRAIRQQCGLAVRAGRAIPPTGRPQSAANACMIGLVAAILLLL